MKIAYLAQSYPPMLSGAALMAERLAKELAARGHEVLVIAASDQEHGYLIMENELTILRLRSIYNPLRVGQRFLIYPRRAILRSLHKFQPDIIHTHDPLQMGILALEHARKTNIPVLLSIHQLPWFVSAYLPEIYGIRYATEIALWTYARWLLRQFDALITPTQTIASIINSKTGIEPQTISYGIDLRTFHPHLSTDNEIAIRTWLNLPPNVPVILHVGRLDTDKHVERVILAAISSLQETDAHLLIVGDGRQKPALMELCRSKGIAQRCHFPGYVSVQEGLPAIYRLASLFVTASRIETQGIVLLEAAASGLPILAVRAACVPETVQDGLNGYLTEPGNDIALGNRITELLKDSEKARKLGQAGRRLARKHNIRTTVDAFENLYADLIKQKEMQRYPEKIQVHKWQDQAKDWLNL
jgi:glycosyltransferase involved in cell wall biosynthesis